MSDLADLLYARADETADEDLVRLIEHHGGDPADPEVREAVRDTFLGASIELQRAAKHVGIAFLDALPLVGPWFLRQFAAWKVET